MNQLSLLPFEVGDKVRSTFNDRTGAVTDIQDFVDGSATNGDRTLRNFYADGSATPFTGRLYHVQAPAQFHYWATVEELIHVS